MGVRLDPADEYMHELGPEPNFNESMYVNVFDHARGVGGWFRLGNRANEGHAEMTVCLYMPPRDGGDARRVGFMFKRPEIDGNDVLDAGGLSWTMVTPFEELHIAYHGRVLMLDDPEQMVDPKAAFSSNPLVECTVDLVITGPGRASMFGGEPDRPHEPTGEEFAKGHYEQSIAGRGTITVGDERWEVQGWGLRDHSWGPRYWQAPWYYRWLTGTVDDGFGFMASRVARRDGPGTRGGFVYEDGVLHLCDDVQVSSEFVGDGRYHDRITAQISSSRSTRQWALTGEVVSLIPLRNRRESPDGELLVTRISEAMTRWTITGDDGRQRVGYGMSEYLDQIVDGAPVGLAE